jgi:signal transduction histidine kinase
MKPGQKFEIIPCKKPVPLVQDRKVVDIILRNIIYNSIKYSPANSTIQIKIRINDNVHIKIRDEGIGIPEEAREHIFDRFYRAKNVLHIQGTGIGLNIVRRHLLQMKGSIEISSKENEGTTVFVTMPVMGGKPQREVDERTLQGDVIRE